MTQTARIDMTGQRFGRLTVIGFAETIRGRAWWRASCDCGESAIVPGKNLRRGLTKSCGCYHRETLAASTRTHGMTNSGAHRTWSAMLGRCTNPNHSAYSKYGAKGVKVCARWRNSFENFYADMGERPNGFSLERRNPFGDYEPGNCHWATAGEQSCNRRGDVAIAILEDLVAHGHATAVQAAFERRYGTVSK